MATLPATSATLPATLPTLLIVETTRLIENFLLSGSDEKDNDCCVHSVRW